MMGALLIRTGRNQVLDIGGGPGAQAFVLERDYNFDMTVFDPSPASIQMSRLLGLRAIQGGLPNLPFGDQIFEGSYSRTVFHHIEDHVAAFKEVYRILKPMGTFVVQTFSKGQTLQQWPCRVLNTQKARKLTASLWPSVSSLIDAAHQAGFSAVRLTTHEKEGILGLRQLLWKILTGAGCALIQEMGFRMRVELFLKTLFLFRNWIVEKNYEWTFIVCTK